MVRKIFGDIWIQCSFNDWFRIHRSKKEWECFNCDKKSKSGSFYVGKYTKYCLPCVRKRFLPEVDEFYRNLDRKRKELINEIEARQGEIVVGEL